ncbi:hypothetical protein [Halomarina litorea]|uniref:hypothetical protein n=1 Tax=Halomarina litorea TaxID=2961595 RepID=UPI0020C332DA|nr:hypothetical protein [Halomarina sp. BCD28]
MFLPSIFFICFSLSAFCVSIYYSGEESVYFAYVFSVPLLLSQSLLFSPWTLGFEIVPIAILSFLKCRSHTRKQAWYIVCALLSLAITIYHPLAILLLAVFYTLYLLSTIIFSKWISNNHSTPWHSGEINLIAISTISFFVYHIQLVVSVGFESLLLSLQEFGVLSTNTGEKSVSSFETYSSVYQSHSPQLGDIAQILVFKYGVVLALLPVTALASIILLNHRDYICSEIKQNMFVLIILSGCYTMFALIALFGNLVAGFERFMSAIILVSALIPVALRFRQLPSTSKITRKIYDSISTVIVIIVVFIVVFGLFSSPITRGTNPQVTQAEFQVTSWLLDYSGEDNSIHRFGPSIKRISTAITGVHNRKIWGVNSSSNITFRESDRSVYKVVSRKGKYVYPKLYPEYRGSWQYSPSKVDNVESKEGTWKIYSSGSVDIYA